MIGLNISQKVCPGQLVLKYKDNPREDLMDGTCLHLESY